MTPNRDRPTGGYRPNFKFTVADVDKIVAAARRGVPAYRIADDLRPRIETDAAEIIRIVHESGGHFSAGGTRI